MTLINNNLYFLIFQASLEVLHVNGGSDSPRNFEIRRPKSAAAVPNTNNLATPPTDMPDFEVAEPHSDIAIVPKRGPRPPARKRPKSTPIPHDMNYMKPERKR